jgi:MFS family permease
VTGSTGRRTGAVSVIRMRRLVMLVSALVFVDTMLFAALTPLLGRFEHELHLSSATAGLLVAAYAAGALVGGLPGGVAAARMGPRRAVLTGLALMATASLGFAFSDSLAALSVTRFLQGLGSAFTWAGAFSWLIAAAPRERRGTLIGTAMGAAVFGALFGPVVGALAAETGRAAVFCGVSVLAGILAATTLTIPSNAPERPSLAALRRAGSNGEFRGGLGLLALGSLLAGILSVLSPLHLSHAGWGPSAVGAVWLVAAALEAVGSPLIGSLSDRRGTRVPVLYGLVAGGLASLLLVLAPAGPVGYAILIVAASCAFGALFTPAFALIADGAERSGLAQGMAFGMMNAAWALGAMAGPAGAGVLDDATGEHFPFLLAALACLGTVMLLMRRPREPLAASVAEG